MRHLVALALLTISVFATPTAGVAQIYQRVSPDTSLISVSATAQEHIAASRARVSLQVVTAGGTAESSAMANGGARGAVREALAPLGYGPEELTLWGFGTGPSSGGRYGGAPGGIAEPFETKAGLRLVVDDLSQLDPVVSTALLAGATVSTIEFESDGFDEALERATEVAVTRARAQAEVLARSEGGRLGGLLRLSTTPDYVGMSASEQRYMMYAGGPGSDGVVLFPLDGIVKVTVSAEWAFER